MNFQIVDYQLFKKIKTILSLKNIFTIFLSLCFSFSFLFTQTVNLDSLENEFKKENTTEKRVQFLEILTEEGAVNQPQKTLEFGKICLQLEPENFDCLLGLASANFHLAKPKVTEELATKAAEIAESENNLEGLISAYLVLQETQRVLEKKEKAFQTLQKALQVAEQNNLEFQKGKIYVSLGFFTIYHQKADRKRGIEYLKKAVEILEKNKPDTFLADTYQRLGSISKDAEEAFLFLEKALNLYQKLDDNVSVGWTFFILGSTSEEFENFENALDYYQKGLKIHREIGAKGGVADHLLNIGNLYNKMNQPDLAIPFLEEGLALAKEIPLLPNLRDCYRALSSAYAKKNDFAQAYQNLAQSNLYKDSLIFERMTNQVAEFNAKFETEEKELELTQKELEISTQKNLRNQILIGALFLLMLLSAVFQYRIYKQRQKKKEADLALALEQKEAVRLRELDKLKSGFFTNISHELRTPLTLIIAPLQQAVSELRQVSIEKYLKTAQNNSQKLLNLINEILDFSKLEAGKLEVEESEIELQQLSKRIFFSFESAADLRGIDWQFSYQISDVFWTKVDVPKFEKILNNLLGNALKFTRKGGEVELTILANPQYPDFPKSGTPRKAVSTASNARHPDLGKSGYWETIQFIIKDSGKGIAKEDLPRVFDRFFQSKTESENPQGGSGIGLALAKDLANLMGGDLTVESEIGKGSSFILTLSLVQIENKKQPISELEIEKNSPKSVENESVITNIDISGKPKILVVEDNPEMSQYLQNALSKNYTVTPVFDGQEALDKLEKEKFDLITSDVMMPNMDGFTFLENLNKRDVFRQVPFILLTARVLPEDKLRGFRLGVDDYITKPFHLPELEARIAILLQNSKTRTEIISTEKNGQKELTAEQELVENAQEIVLKNIANLQFKVENLAREVGYSQRQLSRVFRKITGMTPVNFILEIRLQKARQLLESRQFMTVSEVRYEIGIESASYFTKKFTQRFGKNPKEYLNDV